MGEIRKGLNSEEDELEIGEGIVKIRESPIEGVVTVLAVINAHHRFLLLHPTTTLFPNSLHSELRCSFFYAILFLYL